MIDENKIPEEYRPRSPQEPSYYASSLEPYVPTSTNLLGVLSFAFSFLAILPLFSIAAVILGHIALYKINRTNQNGRIFAYIGTILGYFGVIFWLGFYILNASF